MAEEVPSYASVSDAELLRAFAEHADQEAFTALTDRYINLVFSAARRMMGNRHDAEDITQAVFLILARAAGGIDHHVVLPAWLYRTTLFVCKDARRAQFRRTRREMAAAMQPPASVHDSSANKEPQWVELLDAAMASLGESDRTLLILRYFQGQSVTEISSALRVAPNSISKRLERAVGRLRRFFIRRGVVLTGTALSVGLTSHAVGAAPIGLSASVALGATVSANFAAVTTAHALAKGALLAMKTSMQIKSALIVVAAILVLLGSAGLILHIFSGGSDVDRPTQTVVLSNLPSAPNLVNVPSNPPVASRPRSDLAEYLPGGTIPVLADPTRKKDHGLGQTIEAELMDDSHGVDVVAPGLSNWAQANSVRYDDVDFGSPAPLASASETVATDFFANIACPTGVKASLQVRLDKASAAPICTLIVAPNGGILQRNAQRVSLAQSVQGRHTVYLTLNGGAGIFAVNLDWLKFVCLPRSATRRIDADQFDAMRGAAVTDAGLAHLDTGDFLRYSSVAFGQGVNYVHVNCGVRKQYAGRFIVFHIDDLNGPIIAQLKVRETGDFTQFETQTAPVTSVKGLHDLYLTFNGNGVANIEWFQFGNDSAVPATDRAPASSHQSSTTRTATTP